MRKITIVLGYSAIFLIYAPIFWLAVMSFSERPLTGFPWPLTGSWYARLYEDTRWVEPIELSLMIAFIVALLCMLASTLVGRSLPALRRRGGILFAFLLPLFVPGIVLGVTLFMFYRSFLGIRTGLWSLVLVHFVWAFPFALLALLVVAVRFRSPPPRGCHRSRCQCLAALLAHRVSGAQAGNHRRPLLWLPALL